MRLRGRRYRRCRRGRRRLSPNSSPTLGPVDILINNAGFSDHPTFARTDPAGWQTDINGNLNGAYYCAHAVLPGMKEKRGGSIVAIGSVNGIGALGRSRLQRRQGRHDLAHPLARAGIWPLRHPLQYRAARHGAHAALGAAAPRRIRKFWRSWCAGIRSAASSSPIDVARAVGFLASDAAAAITGVALPVDCGLTAGNIVMARELTLEDF